MRGRSGGRRRVVSRWGGGGEGGGGRVGGGQRGSGVNEGDAGR